MANIWPSADARNTGVVQHVVIIPISDPGKKARSETYVSQGVDHPCKNATRSTAPSGSSNDMPCIIDQKQADDEPAETRR